MARRSTSVPPWSRAVSRSESDPKLGGGGASASSAPWDRPRGRATEDRVRRSGGASAASAPPLQSPDESMGDRPYCLAHYWDEKRGQYHYTDTISGLSSWNKEELLATIKKAPWKTKSEDVITAPTDIGQSRGLLAYSDCPGGHGLALFDTLCDGWWCSSCHETFVAGSAFFSCRICDHDECRRCATSSRSHAAAISNCKGFHGLSLCKTPADGWWCSACHEDFERGSTFYSCHLCDYDECAACATKPRQHRAGRSLKRARSPRRKGLHAVSSTKADPFPEGVFSRGGDAAAPAPWSEKRRLMKIDANADAVHPPDLYDIAPATPPKAPTGKGASSSRESKIEGERITETWDPVYKKMYYTDSLTGKSSFDKDWLVGPPRKTSRLVKADPSVKEDAGVKISGKAKLQDFQVRIEGGASASSSLADLPLAADQADDEVAKAALGTKTQDSQFGGGGGASASSSRGEVPQDDASLSVAQVSLRKGIVDLYRTVNPSKLATVDALMQKYLGHEVSLYVAICSKYGVAPSVEHIAPQPPTAFKEEGSAASDTNLRESSVVDASVDVALTRLKRESGVALGLLDEGRKAWQLRKSAEALSTFQDGCSNLMDALIAHTRPQHHSEEGRSLHTELQGKLDKFLREAGCMLEELDAEEAVAPKSKFTVNLTADDKRLLLLKTLRLRHEAQLEGASLGKVVISVRALKKFQKSQLRSLKHKGFMPPSAVALGGALPDPSVLPKRKISAAVRQRQKEKRRKGKGKSKGGGSAPSSFLRAAVGAASLASSSTGVPLSEAQICADCIAPYTCIRAPPGLGDLGEKNYVCTGTLHAYGSAMVDDYASWYECSPAQMEGKTHGHYQLNCVLKETSGTAASQLLSTGATMNRCYGFTSAKNDSCTPWHEASPSRFDEKTPGYFQDISGFRAASGTAASLLLSEEASLNLCSEDWSNRLQVRLAEMVDHVPFFSSRACSHLRGLDSSRSCLVEKKACHHHLYHQNSSCTGTFRLAPALLRGGEAVTIVPTSHTLAAPSSTFPASASSLPVPLPALTLEDLFPTISTKSSEEPEPQYELIEKVVRLGSLLTDHKEQAGPVASFSTRQRDPLPLPEINLTQLDTLDSKPDIISSDLVLGFLNATIFVINSMYGLGQPSGSFALTSCQRSIVNSLCAKTVRLLSLCLHSTSSFSPEEAFLSITNMDAPTHTDNFDASSFDLVDPSAGFDPSIALDKHSSDILESPDVLFQNAPQGLDKFGHPRPQHLRGYAELVSRQLRCGKVSLDTTIKAGAAIFPVGKKGSQKLREVWSGDRVSAAALRPPKPPLLASPSALLWLECSEDDPIHVSKRDGKCLFDQLKLPSSLRPWFGRPPVIVKDLLTAGLSLQEIKAAFLGAGQLQHTTKVFPVSNVYPMGFSWSSFVAQSSMLRVCHQGGLARTQILSDSSPPPRQDGPCWALATDDIMIFTRASSASTKSLLNNVDRSFQRNNILKHEAKDVNDSANGTVIGIDLLEGRFLTPSVDSVVKFLAAIVHIASCGSDFKVAPLQLASILGVAQWHAQLNRPTYSIFFYAYDFVKILPGDIPLVLPSSVLQELLHFAFILPCLEADLTRPWLPEILASDASPDFGFGLSSYPCPSSFARSVGRLAVQPGAYVEVDLDDNDQVKRPKLGTPVKIGVHIGRFRTKLSLKAKYKAHSGALEAAGISVMLRWLLRSPSKHGTRVTALIDAQAVLGAVTKGRSSAPTLRHEVKRIGALSLAGGWCLRYVYVPSAFNPADAPSRGKHLSGSPLRGPRKKTHPNVLSADEKLYRDWKRSYRKLRAFR